jgi:hypothetical protein
MPGQQTPPVDKCIVGETEFVSFATVNIPEKDEDRWFNVLADTLSSFAILDGHGGSNYI